MKEGLDALNAIVDVVLAYRPKQKTKKVRKATKAGQRKKSKPMKRE